MAITGRVKIEVGSDILLNKEGATASGIGLSGRPAFTREAITGDQGIHGFVEKPIVPQLEVTITDSDKLSLNTLAEVAQNGTTIAFAPIGPGGTAGGKEFILSDAFCTNDITLTAGDGETTVVFQGNFWTERIN